MPQVAGSHSGQKRHNLHSGVQSGLNARACVFEHQAFLWRHSQSVGRHTESFRVWLSISDLVDGHNDLRERQAGRHNARLGKRPPSGSHNGPGTVLECTRPLLGPRPAPPGFPQNLYLLIMRHLFQFLSVIPPGQKVLHGCNRRTPVREREYGLERNPMPFCPPAPGTFYDMSRIDQRPVHIKQHCPASQSQRNEITLGTIMAAHLVGDLQTLNLR